MFTYRTRTAQSTRQDCGPEPSHKQR